MVAELAPLPALKEVRSQLTGFFLVTEDDFGVALQVVEALRQRGADAVLISKTILQDAANMPERLASLLQAKRSVTGLIHVAGLATVPLPDKLAEWQSHSQVQVRSLFQLLQLSAADLQQQGGLVYSASLLGGAFGRDLLRQQGSPLAGGCSGMLKTLMLEWDNVQAKAIDFSTQSTPAEIADSIVQEVLNPDTNIEIGYFDQQRWAFKPLRQDLNAATSRLMPDTALQPSADWVVLCIGGASGITAEVLDEILQPGMTAVVIGRSTLDWQESELTQGIDDPSRLRQVLIQQAQRQRIPPTPVQIEAQVKQIQRYRSIQTTLDRFRQRGIQVDYHAVDVTDEATFAPFLTQLYDRYGRIDAVIQGAGVIQDKLIRNKSLTSFNQVFQAKVDSTFILCRYLRPETLKLLILFTSVAGRTGNRGQVDYAAANEVLNRLAWWMRSHWSQTRVLSINWGPWEGTGMASDAVNRQFRDRGVIPIPIAAGREFVARELANGTQDDVELITGFFNGDQPEEAMIGEPTTQSPIRSSTLPPDPPPTIDPLTILSTPLSNHPPTINSLTTPLLPYPLIPLSPSISTNGHAILDHEISLQTHPYLRDHQIDQIPVLPAAGALELLAEFVQSIWPNWVVTAVEDLRVLRGITLKTAPNQQIRLQAEPVVQDGQTLCVTAKAMDPVTQQAFYQANFLLSAQPLPSFKVDNIVQLGAVSPLDVQSAYRQYCFHQGLFQVLTAISGFNQQGVDAQAHACQPQEWLNLPDARTSGWLFDPGIVDATLQLALIWTHIHGDTGALPTRFGKVTRYHFDQPFTNLELVVRIQHFSLTKMIFNAWILNADKYIVLQLERMENTCSKALNRLAKVMT